MTDVIRVHDLVKTFGRTTALDGLDLTVREGEVHGFLGPNGSGKSTTIRVLLGLLRADSGEATVLGMDPWHDATELHRRLAYVPGDVVLWPSLTGGEVVDLLGRLRGGLDESRRRRLVDAFALDERTKGRAYSKGNRQKVALVAALASDVPLLVLDEPTSGLDPLDGAGVPGGAVGGPGRGAHRAALEPHPQRGRTGLRPGEHRAGGARRRHRQPRRAAPPHPQPGARRPAGRPLPRRGRLVAGTHDVVVEGDTLTCSVEAAHLGELVAALGPAGSRPSPASRPRSRSSSSRATTRGRRSPRDHRQRPAPRVAAHPGGHPRPRPRRHARAAPPGAAARPGPRPGQRARPRRCSRSARRRPPWPSTPTTPRRPPGSAASSPTPASSPSTARWPRRPPTPSPSSRP